MRTPEGKVKHQIKKILDRFGVWYRMYPGSPYGQTFVDFVGCVAGQMYAIEAKRLGETATARQRLTLQEVEEHGGRQFLIDGTNYDQLEKTLMEDTLSSRHKLSLQPTLWLMLRRLTAKASNEVDRLFMEHPLGKAAPEWVVTFADGARLVLTEQEVVAVIHAGASTVPIDSASPVYNGLARIYLTAGVSQ